LWQANYALRIAAQERKISRSLKVLSNENWLLFY